MWDTIFSQEYATECYGKEKFAEGRAAAAAQYQSQLAATHESPSLP